MAQLAAHHYNGAKPSRYYIDGKRVAQPVYETAKSCAIRNGTLNSLQSKPGNKKSPNHWIHYCCT